MRFIGQRLAFSIVLISFAFTVSPADVGSQKDRRKVPQPLKITVAPWGPTQADIDAAKLRTENSETVRSILNNTNHRLMSLEYIGSQNNKKPPTRFRIIYYDYTNNRTYTAEGDFAGTEKIKVLPADFQPGVSDEELEDAYKLAAADRDLRRFSTKAKR